VRGLDNSSNNKEKHAPAGACLMPLYSALCTLCFALFHCADFFDGFLEELAVVGVEAGGVLVADGVEGFLGGGAVGRGRRRGGLR